MYLCSSNNVFGKLQYRIVIAIVNQTNNTSHRRVTVDRRISLASVVSNWHREVLQHQGHLLTCFSGHLHRYRESSLPDILLTVMDLRGKTSGVTQSASGRSVGALLLLCNYTGIGVHSNTLTENARGPFSTTHRHQNHITM